MDQTPQIRLAEAIDARAAKRGLTGDITRFRYANRYIYGEPEARPKGHALYVGVGHGLDALLALLDGHCATVAGLDPYKSKDGNDEEDYARLISLVEALGLSERFTVHRTTVDEYLRSPHEKADVIVINDVLHHIFVTRQKLSESSLFSSAVAMFRALREAATADARLVVGEMSRYNLRRVFSHSGLHRPGMRYHTKQDWREWNKAIEAAGWQLESMMDYVPYRLRSLRSLLSPLGRYTLLDRYVLVYRPAQAAAS